MSIMTLYVQASSKKAINDRLAEGLPVVGIRYTPFDQDDWPLDANLAPGTVIKIFEKYVLGSPFAKAYGNWDAKNNRVR